MRVVVWMPRIAGVYASRCVPTGQVSIGRSRDVAVRWLAHRAELRRGAHCNASPRSAWLRLGEDVFVFELVEGSSPASRWLRRSGGGWSVWAPGHGFNVAPPTRLGEAAGGGGWRRQLTYKAAWSGSRVVVASRWEPSSKTCSSCGWVDDD
jgi:hypothetical protein